VRGRQGAGRPHLELLGLIPACAGQTFASRPSFTARPAHPRVCGADLIGANLAFTTYGSSPRVRGRQKVWRCKQKPARAHPRVCGADPQRVIEGLQGQGSSPRVRGRRWPVRHGQYPRGLIPACAGQTPGWPGPRSWRRAHPRVCGADTWAPIPIKAQAGSSPRVRGRQRVVNPRQQEAGLIPACAGQTLGDQRCCIGRRAFGDNSVARF